MIVEFVGGPWDGDIRVAPDHTPEIKVNRLTMECVPIEGDPDAMGRALENMRVGIYRRALDPPRFGDPWPYEWQGEREMETVAWE